MTTSRVESRKTAVKPKRSPPRVCQTPGCGHRAMHHVPKGETGERACKEKSVQGGLPIPAPGTPCPCDELRLPPRKKRRLLLPWERKISPRPLGRVGTRWRESLRGTRSLSGGVFVLWDLVRNRAHVIGSAKGGTFVNEDPGVVPQALAFVRTAEKIYPASGGRREPLLSRGAAALWWCAEDDPETRRKALAFLVGRFRVRTTCVLEADPAPDEAAVEEGTPA